MKKISIGFVLTLLHVTVWAVCPSWPSGERFTVTGAEVSDVRTGLTWKRCSEGQSWSGIACTGTATSPTHEAALTLAKNANPGQSATGWRLPNVKELGSLADKGCNFPAIDRAVFPDTPRSFTWSSSPDAGNPASAWGVNFNSGAIGVRKRDLAGHVRLVRVSP